MVHIVKSADTESGKLFIEAVVQSFERAESGLERVAFDCEGINLSRIGTVELISICFSSLTVFLIDFGGTPDRIIEEHVKRLFESNTIIKIIHDCRMDSDALFHRPVFRYKMSMIQAVTTMLLPVKKIRVSTTFLFTMGSPRMNIETRACIRETRTFGQIAL
jgi:hypothetical protein